MITQVMTPARACVRPGAPNRSEAFQCSVLVFYDPNLTAVFVYSLLFFLIMIISLMIISNHLATVVLFIYTHVMWKIDDGMTHFSVHFAKSNSRAHTKTHCVRKHIF